MQGAVAVATKSSLAGVVSPSVIGLTGSAWGFAGWGAIAAAAAALMLAAVTTFVVWDRLAPSPAPAPVLEFAGAQKQRTVQRSFRGKQFDAEFFRWAGPEPERYIRHEDEGLRITLPPENGPADAVGVKLRHRVREDFEVEAKFEFLNIPRPAAGSGGGVAVYFYLATPENDGLWLGKMNDNLRGPIFNVGQRIWQEQKRVNKFVKNVPAKTETGLARVRVVRKGATFSLFAAEGEVGEFIPVETVNVSAADCTIVRFAADPIWRPDIAIDVRLIDFTMTAEEFVGYEPHTPQTK